MARGLYEAHLKADDAWLTVAGLFWLHEGENRFGSAPGNDVVLPAPAPAHTDHFDLQAGKTTVHVNRGVPITIPDNIPKPVLDKSECQV